MKELFWYLGQYGGLSETSLEAPEDPGDAVHLVVGEALQLSVQVERVRGRIRRMLDYFDYSRDG